MPARNWKRRQSKLSKSVKFCKSGELVPSKQALTIKQSSEPPTVCDLTNIGNNSGARYENKILYYLSKLKDYWCSSPLVSENVMPHRSVSKETGKERFVRLNSASKLRQRVSRNVMKPMVPRPRKYCSENRMLLKRPITPKPRISCIKKVRPLRKAENIVAATIDYGIANGIISKNGKYFWFNDEMKPIRRSITPGIALKHRYTSESYYNDDKPVKQEKQKENEVELKAEVKNSCERPNSVRDKSKQNLTPRVIQKPPYTEKPSANASIMEATRKKSSNQVSPSKKSFKTNADRNSVYNKNVKKRKGQTLSRSSFQSAISATSVESLTPPKKKCKCKMCTRRRRRK